MKTSSDGLTRADKVKEITRQLEDGIEELFQSGKFQEYLKTMARFHRYSFNNSMLIYMQMPAATRVAGFNTWKSLRRFVKKGERGIKIFAPCGGKNSDAKNSAADNDETEETTTGCVTYYTIVSVFDISQTEGEPLKVPCQSDLSGSVAGYKLFMDALHSVSPVPIAIKEIADGSKGYYSPATSEIAIKAGMGEAHTVKTAIHEVTHSILHTKDKMMADKKDRQTKEVEAEAVAFTVCQHFGIDTSGYSFEYIAGWGSGRDMKELKASMNVIRLTACEMIDSIESRLTTVRAA